MSQTFVELANRVDQTGSLRLATGSATLRKSPRLEPSRVVVVGRLVSRAAGSRLRRDLAGTSHTITFLTKNVT